MSILGFSIGTWMEHIAVGFLATISLIFIACFFKKSKKLKFLIIPTLSTFIGVLAMFLSPGMHQSRTVVGQGSILQLVENNLFKFFFDIVSSNLYLFFILFLFIIISLLKSLKDTTSNKNKVLKLIFAFQLIVSDVLILISYLYKYCNIEFLSFIQHIYPQNITDFSLVHNILIVIYALDIVLSLLTIKVEKRYKYMYILSIMLFSLLPMCLTPNVGSRISSIGFFMIVCFTVWYFLDMFDLKKKDLLKVLVVSLCLVSFDKTVLLIRRIYTTTTLRNEIIDAAVIEQKMNRWNYDDYLVLPYYHHDDVMYDGVVSQGSFHYSLFLSAYDLGQNTKVVFSNEDIVFDVVRNEKKFDVVNIKNYYDENDRIEYMFVLQYKEGNAYSEIMNSGWQQQDNYEFESNNKGEYNVKVYYKGDDGVINELKENHYFTVE